MACRSCDLKRIYKLFEDKKRREAEAAKAAAEAAEREKRESEEKARCEEAKVIKAEAFKKTKKVAQEVSEDVVIE